MNEGTLTTAVPPLGWSRRWCLDAGPDLAAAHRQRLRASADLDLRGDRLLRSSIRTSLPSPPLATQTLSPSVAIAVGVLPTGIVVITEPVAGSIDLTVPSSAFATQTARFPTAIADGPRPTGIGVIAPEESTRTTRLASR